MTDGYDYDLFIIGAGSGGVRAARSSAALGARVAIAEERAAGGTCVNAGCVPKKLLFYASEFGIEVEDARGYGWTVEGARLDWATLIANKDREIARINRVYRHTLDAAGVAWVDGRAVLQGPHTVLVGEARYTAENILIATGGWPAVPSVPGAEHVITSNEVFHLPELPERIAIVGGGYIAVEFAGIFRGLGRHVTLVHRRQRVLRRFDEGVRDVLTAELARGGIEMALAREVTRIERGPCGVTLHLDDETTREADLVLYATGRRPHTEGLGLKTASIAIGPRGGIKVDAGYRTSAASIYAIGDVIDRIQLTPVALAEGMYVAHTLFGGEPHAVPYPLVPSSVFSQPEVATVGLTESEASARYAEIDTYSSTFRPMKHRLTGREEQSFMKLVIDRQTDRLLGCHIVAPHAGEIIQGFAVAMTCGATKRQLDATLGIHPTAAEELVTMRTPDPPRPRPATQ